MFGEIKMLSTKENLIDLLEKAHKEFQEFKAHYQGSGFKMRLKRFLRYKGYYLRYVLERLKILKPSLNYYYLLRSGSGIEIKSIKFLIKNLKDHDIFKTGEIHAFEPLPKAFAYLKHNFGNFKNIFLNNVALGNENKEIIFYQDLYEGTSGSSTLLKDVAVRNLKNFKEIKVKMIKLDDYLKNHKKPKFIKIDVEGSENLVINGGKDFFINEKPIIIMEIWSGKNGIDFSLKAADNLFSLGYKCFFINENGDLIEFSYGDLLNWIQTSDQSNDNFVFTK